MNYEGSNNRTSHERLMSTIQQVSIRLLKHSEDYSLACDARHYPKSENKLSIEEMTKLKSLILDDVQVLGGALSEFDKDGGSSGFPNEVRHAIDDLQSSYPKFPKDESISDEDKQAIESLRKMLLRIFGAP